MQRDTYYNYVNENLFQDKQFKMLTQQPVNDLFDSTDEVYATGKNIFSKLFK